MFDRIDHVGIAVADLDSAIALWRDQLGLALIDEQPRTGIRGSRVAFINPSATARVLVEIVEPSREANGHAGGAGAAAAQGAAAQAAREDS